MTSLPATYSSIRTSAPNVRALSDRRASSVRSRTIDTPTLEPSLFGFTTSGSCAGSANDAPIARRIDRTPGGVGKPSGLPDALAGDLVHRERARQHARAGVRNPHHLEQTLHAAVLAVAPVERVEGDVDAQRRRAGPADRGRADHRDAVAALREHARRPTRRSSARSRARPTARRAPPPPACVEIDPSPLPHQLTSGSSWIARARWRPRRAISSMRRTARRRPRAAEVDDEVGVPLATPSRRRARVP